MTLIFTLTTLLLYFSFLTPSATAATEPELRSLIEFRKGITDDPTNLTVSWTLTSSLLSDPKSCPDSWPGVTCDSITGSIVSIDLTRRSLAGELKFNTLLGLTSLQNLSLAGNRFSGRLVPALGSISSLQHLDLSDNLFYGPIPRRITDLWGLNYLNLSGNRFRGGFPQGLQNLQQLRALDLHRNELWGDIGEILSQLKNVELIDLSDNRFSGGLSIPTENLSSIANTLHHLNLSRNNLNGGFLNGDSISLFKNLEVLDLGDNQISGELPSFGAELPNLKVLRLVRNQLFGPVPEELLQSSVQLQELDLSGNGFTGSIREVNTTTLNLLNLSSNALSGDLPSTLRRCLAVDLSDNMFSGDISVIQKWEANLEYLDLSSNKLSGSIPDLTSQFARLSVLKIRNNSLVGRLPTVLDTSEAPKISEVDLSLNQFSGPIPASFFSLASLRSLNLSRNHLTGPIPLQRSGVTELLALPSYPQMESLDLSSNLLTGVLPADIGGMEKLRVLNLASNGLSGELPSELSKLNGLVYLDLSSNNFKGEIPSKLPSDMVGFNVSHNDLSGIVPENLRRFPRSSFYPGNSRLVLPGGMPSTSPVTQDQLPFHGRHHSSKNSIRIAIIVAAAGAAFMILFVLLAYHRAHVKQFNGRSGLTGQATDRDVKLGRSSRPSLFNFHSNAQHPSSSLSFSGTHLLTSNSKSLSGQTEFAAEVSEHSLPGDLVASSVATNPNLLDNHPATSGRKSSPGSPLSSSPCFSEQPVMLDVYSPDRLAGELYFLDASLKFTPEELSRAPAEVLGRSSHGTLYKATLDNGHMLTVKWLRVGLVRHKKEFAKEVKKIGSIMHPNIVPLRAYYWGPREQERLLLADYTRGDSLALHLYETTPRRYSPLSFSQRLRVAVNVARCLLYLHDRALPHGNLKPTNIILASPDYTVRLTDYGLHRLMTPAGVAEQILNMGALGYCAPELAAAAKPVPTFKSDVYSFGVIMMELLTRRSAGDIISGQSGAVDLTDWVRLCDQEGRRMDCIDRDMAGGEEALKGMDDMLAVSLRCIHPVNERPNIGQVVEDLSSISV